MEIDVRKKAKDEFDKTKIDKQPIFWHIWKRAFGRGYSLKSKQLEELTKENKQLKEKIKELEKVCSHEWVKSTVQKNMKFCNKCETYR